MHINVILGALIKKTKNAPTLEPYQRALHKITAIKPFDCPVTSIVIVYIHYSSETQNIYVAYYTYTLNIYELKFLL